MMFNAYLIKKQPGLFCYSYLTFSYMNILTKKVRSIKYSKTQIVKYNS